MIEYDFDDEEWITIHVAHAVNQIWLRANDAVHSDGGDPGPNDTANMLHAKLSEHAVSQVTGLAHTGIRQRPRRADVGGIIEVRHIADMKHNLRITPKDLGRVAVLCHSPRPFKMNLLGWYPIKEGLEQFGRDGDQYVLVPKGILYPMESLITNLRRMGGELIGQGYAS